MLDSERGRKKGSWTNAKTAKKNFLVMNHCKIVGVIEILRSGEKLGIENDIKRQLVLVNVLILARWGGSSGKKCCGSLKNG